MSVINLLSPHVADLIAAGEVVERPASVVKELMENSMDAGARSLTVEIARGGMGMIRVTDDGSGMSPEDAGLCFLRHATSKLRDESGLAAISTMGFRGEALAAISAVSHIELRTRRAEENEGTRVTLSGGDIDAMGPVGCRVGTVMTVKDLFFNTPARQKFMKSDRSEGSACMGAALRSALGRPDISVRFIRDGEEQFFSPGDGSAKSCVYSLLGRDVASGLLECRSVNGGISVSGFVFAPRCCRGNRSGQFFYINGRPFKSAQLQAALEQAYKNSVMTGRFPACVLYLTIDPAQVDVNVHPAKTEVKFTNEREAFDAVYYAAREALAAENGAAQIDLSATTKRAVEPNPAFYKKMTAEEYREKAAAPRPAPQTRLDLGSVGGTFAMREPSRPLEPSRPATPPRIPSTPATPQPAAAEKPETQPPKAEEEEPVRVIGEALGTYIIAERGDCLLLIDKHAAHERVIFERLKAQSGAVMSQTLLVPVAWTPGGDTAELLAENAAELERFGFEVELYGANSVVIRAVPADCEGSETALLEEVAEKLRTGHPGGAADEILHTIACKAAIKAGKRSEKRELEALVRDVLEQNIKYCPHGRPVCVELTRRELDKQFKRIV
ncbi:MAG: DNA mismatch repair endonuclease MutL [Oscillospiraceae bacterium]|nr:DNA mismatch repair endonuclease MutL [Oscillospiraceae bacterium]